MYNAIEIADFFVQLTNDLPGYHIDTEKLNALLYYAQGWCLAELHRPLFSGPVIAGQDGPVVKGVSETFAQYGSADITEPSAFFDERRLSSDELCLLVDLYRAYGGLDGRTLMDKAKEAGGPWALTFRAEGKAVLIPYGIMADHFSRQDLPRFKINEAALNIVTALPPEDGDY